MHELSLGLPLFLLAAGAVVAALFGLPAVGRRVDMLGRGWLLAVAPGVAFAVLVAWQPGLVQSRTLTVPWLPSQGLSVSLYLDPLAGLFALLVTGIGTLVVLYAGYYFADDPSAWRFLTYLLLFITAMLGLVMAGDVITLFVFWELTSITSFLLVAYKTKDEAARRGAFRALFITGGGGIALLAGLLLVAEVAGSTQLPAILAAGDDLRSSRLYPVMLLLVAFGAFTKSAQVPAHIWLPGAMSAPTPASAYLHSATMVKAGIYLMARLNPALGLTDLWFWTADACGLAHHAHRRLSGLQAERPEGPAGLLHHQPAGCADHADRPGHQHRLQGAGRRRHGPRAVQERACSWWPASWTTRPAPATCGVWAACGEPCPSPSVAGALAALSMAGLPPLFGFLAKETLLATATHPTVPAAFGTALPLAAVAAGALLLAQAGLFVWETFLGPPKDLTVRAHRAAYRHDAGGPACRRCCR